MSEDVAHRMNEAPGHPGQARPGPHQNSLPVNRETIPQTG